MTTLAIALLMGLAGCGGGGGGGGSDDPMVCAAYVDAAEPALILTAVQNATSAASIPVVVLSDITWGGTAVNLDTLPRQASNVRVVGKTLECTLPCGFATTAGTFAFTVSAPGYAPRPVTATASYASSYGSCPVMQAGGNRIMVSLQPA